MRRRVVRGGLLLLVLLVWAVPAAANHAQGRLSSPLGTPLTAPPLVQDGNWQFIANFPAGPGVEPPLGVDVEPFTRNLPDGAHRFVITSSMTIGFSIFDVTNPDAPIRVSDYGAAACGPEAQAQQLIGVLQDGNDFGASATALGAVHGWEDDVQVTPDGKIAILASDAAGRCHDPAAGGFELVDISDPNNPKLLGLLRLRGNSHNSTIDLARPWLAYNSNSDTGSNNFIDVVDFSSCLALNPATCLPHVSRLQFQDSWTTGANTPTPSACHDLTYAGGKLWGACINDTLVLDPSGAWRNGRLTGTDLTDPKQVGAANACTRAAPSLEALSPVTVVDCSQWSVDKWKAAGATSASIRLVTQIVHPGADLDEDAPTDAGIQISHGAAPGYDGKLVLVGDERGGGLNSSPGQCPGGGIWFYDITNPKRPQVTRNADGGKGIFVPLPQDFVQTQGNNCTAHVFWQWAPQGNLISSAWYSSGVQVFRYQADFSSTPATVRFFDRKAYVLPGASTWTSRVYAESSTSAGAVLYFVATDIARGFDFYKLTLNG